MPAPGMRINLIPPYCWYVLVAAAMVVFAFPPLIAGSMLPRLNGRSIGRSSMRKEEAIAALPTPVLALWSS